MMSGPLTSVRNVTGRRFPGKLSAPGFLGVALLLLFGIPGGCTPSKTESPGKTKTETKKTDPKSKPGKKGLEMLKIETDPLAQKIAGRNVTQYILTNKHGLIVTLMDWGATVTSVQVPDKNGDLGEITLRYPKYETYAENPAYFGCTVGRFANRIADGKFTIGQTEHQLSTNDGDNTLHGGKEGFNHRLWTAEPVKTDNSVGVKFTLVSPDGDQGFPGEVTAHVTYSLTNDNELQIEYTATTTKPTHVNLTNHCYWNLAGPGKDVLGHELMLNADRFLPADEELLPTGEIKDVEATPWDFTSPQTIGSRIDDERLGKKDRKGRGYDHCYVIRREKSGAADSLPLAARVYEAKSGRVMEVFTDQPGVQLYTGNFLDGSKNSGGFPKHGALCLECQKFPDAPNQQKTGFPSTLITPETPYTQRTVHRFSVKK